MTIGGPGQGSDEAGLHLNAEREALARRLAERYCNQSGLDCAWYHGEWELLKSVGIVTSSGVDAGQLDRMLQQALEGSSSRSRILLSGAVDDSLLRAVLARTETPPTDIVALDLCGTPLALMRAHAASVRRKIDTVCSDILDYTDEGGFDLIVTHAFLGNFNKRDRGNVLSTWSALLRPGGRVLTVQRIRPPESPPVVGYSPEQVEAFVRTALDKGAGLDREARSRLEQAADRFARNFKVYSITSRLEFEALFTDAGLEFLHLEYSGRPILPGLPGPSTPSGGEFAYVVAAKKAVTS